MDAKGETIWVLRNAHCSRRGKGIVLRIEPFSLAFSIHTVQVPSSCENFIFILNICLTPLLNAHSLSQESQEEEMEKEEEKGRRGKRLGIEERER